MGGEGRHPHLYTRILEMLRNEGEHGLEGIAWTTPRRTEDQENRLSVLPHKPVEAVVGDLLHRRADARHGGVDEPLRGPLAVIVGELTRRPCIESDGWVATV